MVSSPHYERVKKLIELTIEPLGDSDYQENSRSGEAHGKVDNAHSTSSDFATDQSTGQSQTKEGASGWMTDFVGDANLHMGNIRHHEGSPRRAARRDVFLGGQRSFLEPCVGAGKSRVPA